MRHSIKLFSLVCIICVATATLANHDKPRTLGNGFPGVIKKIETAPEMTAALDEAGAMLYSYTRAQIPPEDVRLIEATCPTNSIAFITHQPQKLGRRLLPLIVEFKVVPDHEFSPSLISEDIFDAIKTEKLKKLAKKDFVAMTVLVPESLNLKSSPKGERTEPSKLAMDAITQYYQQLGVLTVNTNQIFIVSNGPTHVDETFDFYAQYPERFTMLICKDAIPNTDRLGSLSDSPGKICIYHPTNISTSFKGKIDSFKYRFEKLGDTLETFEYDSSLPNPWDNTKLLEWMLTHTTNGMGLRGNKKQAYDPRNPTFINGIKCSTSEEICEQKKYWPMAAVDNNEKTYFQSANLVKKGGWWMAEFEKPIEGRVTISCGTLKRKKLEHVYGNVRVEVSADGENWQTKGVISRKKGTFSYVENSGKIKFIRVISYSMQDILLVVRELKIEEL